MGKTAIVTGASSGLGYATALGLAQAGLRLGILCRTVDRARAAAQTLQAESGNGNISPFACDLASHRQIRITGRNMLEHFSRIDILVNNAGVFHSNRTLTEDGLERTFAVNHLAPFLLTHQLMPALRSSGDARIINVGSASHRQGRIHFCDLNLSQDYHGLRAYSQAKLGNVLFTFQFARLCPFPNIAIFCSDPGLVKTGIGHKHSTRWHSAAWTLRVHLWKSLSPQQGAETTLYLAASGSPPGPSGLYWRNCKPRRAAEQAYNDEDGARLWARSSELCGISSYFDAA